MSRISHEGLHHACMHTVRRALQAMPLRAGVRTSGRELVVVGWGFTHLVVCRVFGSVVISLFVSADCSELQVCLFVLLHGLFVCFHFQWHIIFEDPLNVQTTDGPQYQG
jgi:hypothetical protein